MHDSKAVFLSYASDDAAAAQRIADALRDAGVTVWFDKNELRGGEAWDTSIREQIRECFLFLPVISSNTEAREEGYFRREWNLAADRTLDMGHKRAFIVPVAVDDTVEKDANVPDKFRSVQWTRLPAGNVNSNFVAHVQRLLGSDSPARPRSTADTSHEKFPTDRGTAKSARFYAALGLVVIAFAFCGWYFLQGKRSIVPASTTGIEKSIAVLPFVNMSDDPKQEYFADGLTEELLDLLSRVPELHVAARTSAFSFKGKSTDIPTIAKQLLVANVLEGSVRKSGNNIRVTVQLVRADNGYHLWSETFDRRLDDVFKMQDDIAAAVVRSLKMSLLQDTLPKMTVATSTEAYTLYLRALAMEHQWGADARLATVGFLERSVALDPGFAPGWAHLSKNYAWQAQSNDLSRAQVWEKARQAADKAIALDPELAEGHAAKAKVLIWYDWDWPGAREQVRKAIELNPRSPESLLRATFLARMEGRTEEAERNLRTAISEDPLNENLYFNLGNTQLMAGKFTEARESFGKVFAIDPQGDMHLEIAMTYLLEGDAKSALAELNLTRNKDDQEFGLVFVDHAMGHDKESDSRLANWAAKIGSTNQYRVASAYAFKGNADEAFRWLERAYTDRDHLCAEVNRDPLFQALRGDPRFSAFLRKMDLAK